MAAILDEGAMACVSLGRGCLQTRDFAISTYESKNPCKFPVVYREPRFALSKVVLPRPAPSRPQRLPLNAPTPDDCGRHLLVAVLVGLRNHFFRFPRTKPTSANEASGQNHSENNVWT
jgi:hypothetical protein